MAYTITKYHLPQSNETEIHWAGKYGAKGEKRDPKEKATPDQVRRQNQWKKVAEKNAPGTKRREIADRVLIKRAKELGQIKTKIERKPWES